MIINYNTRLAVMYDRLGPYHHARMLALSRRVDLTVVEFTALDKIYDWDYIGDRSAYRRVTLLHDKLDKLHTPARVAARINDVLTGINPHLVAIPGWAEPAALLALQWCLDAGTPATLMSVSQEIDKQRAWWKECVKAKVARQYGSALVGGGRQKDYLEKLGLPGKLIFTRHNVVDNNYFSIGAKRAIHDRSRVCVDLGLPENFFIKSCRFIDKKNLICLINAYAQYARRVGTRPWHLVIIGDGPLRLQLEKQVCNLGLKSHVHLPGFKQYDELPAYYGLAGAYIQASTVEQWGLVVNEAMASGLPVLVSNRCGCAPDLVKDGVNGFTFDPLNVDELARLMGKIASDDQLREKMGKASREIIAHWTPDTFAENLLKAANVAMELPVKKMSLFDRALLRLLCYR